MELTKVTSYKDLNDKLKEASSSFLLLYKDGAEQSICALNNLKEAANDLVDKQLLIANVNEVRDIHSQFNITSAPSLLEFKGNEFKGTVKGCHDPKAFKSFMEHSGYTVSSSDQPSAPIVVVYSTPTCPHCTNLKNYLKQHQVGFRDVDVSKDQRMAQELVKKSGQQGVPQTEINGKVIVGFDKPKIDRMLGLQ